MPHPGAPACQPLTNHKRPPGTFFGARAQPHKPEGHWLLAACRALLAARPEPPARLLLQPLLSVVAPHSSVLAGEVPVALVVKGAFLAQRKPTLGDSLRELVHLVRLVGLALSTHLQTG